MKPNQGPSPRPLVRSKQNMGTIHYSQFISYSEGYASDTFSQTEGENASQTLDKHRDVPSEAPLV